MGRQGCAGWLVVHNGGEVAYCTEERCGRHCPGLTVRHAGGAMSCRLTVDGPCPCCTPEVRRAS